MDIYPKVFAVLLTVLALARPPACPAQTTLQLLGLTNTAWRDEQSANLDRVNWFAPRYDDSAWPSGRGLLAFEVNPLITPPVIIEQPAGKTDRCGGTAMFTIVAAGSDPLSYRWFRNGVALDDDGRVTGATGPTLNIRELRSTDAAIYSIVVNNGAGEETSDAAQLIVDASSCTPNAWQLTAAAGPLGYFTNLTAGQKAAAIGRGWRFTVNSRLVEDSTTLRTMTMAIGTGTRRFALWWDLDSNLNLTAGLEGSRTFRLTEGGIEARQFHRHELDYDAATARMTYRFDERVVTAGWVGQLSSAQNGQVYWGAAVGPGPGVMEINQVAFEIKELGLVASYDAGTQADRPAAMAPSIQGWNREPLDLYPSAERPATSFNDRFADRLLLTGTTAESFGNNINASSETGEPPHAGRSARRSLWWSWTAPFTGGASVTTSGSSFDTTLAVYTGDSLANLVAVTSAARPNVADHVTFRAIAGTSYQFAVDRQSGVGEIALSLALVPTPSNDDYATPRTLAGGNVTDVGSTWGATKQFGELNHAGNAGGRSVWYSWIPPVSGCVVIETTGSDFDTLLAVYRGNFGGLTVVATNDDAEEQLTSGVQFDAVAGIPYRIAVDGYDGAAGRVVVGLALSGAPAGPSAPANDRFTQRINLIGTNLSVFGSTLSATRETDEPVHRAPPCGRSVWWQWTAPSSGGVKLTWGDSDFPVVTKVYTGTSLAGLNAVRLGLPGGISLEGSSESGIFEAVAGQSYQIAVEGTFGGNFRLTLGLRPSPLNDDFPASGVLPLSGNVVLTANNLGATTEPGEQPFGTTTQTSGQSVWWKWRASMTAPTTVSTDGTGFPHILGVFTGASVARLAPVGQSEFGKITFTAIAGRTYYLCVDGLSGSAGAIRLAVQRVTVPGNDLFSSRTVLTGSNIVVRASNIGATLEPNEPPHAGIPGGRSVWWQWGATASGRLFVSTFGSSFDTVLAIYTGPDFAPTVSSLTLLAGNDNYRESGTIPTHPDSSFVAFDYVPRVFPQLQLLYFAVDGKRGVSGDITLALTYVPRPANDAFSSRQALSGFYSTASGSVVAATRQNEEPPLLGSNVARTVWYSWTAPSDPGLRRGAVTLRISGADFIPSVGVFQGDSLSGLRAVTTSTESNAWTRETTFEAIAGETYQIAVGGDPQVDRFGQSFVERAALGPPGSFPEVGSFSMSLEFSTLALRFSNLQVLRELTEIPRKLRFSALAEIANYGNARSRPLRVRLVGVPSSLEMPTLALGTFSPPSPGELAPRDTVVLPINGESPVERGSGLLFGVRWNVYALLEEFLEGEWLPITADLLLVVLPFGTTPAGGGVIITDPPLRGNDNCRSDVTSIEIVTPAYFVEGSTNALSFRVHRKNSCGGLETASVRTNAPWTCNLAGCRVSTNGVLVIPRGAIGVNRAMALSFDYEYRGVANAARASVPVFNREPVLTSPTRLAGGQFQFIVKGPPNSVCLVESSTNLVSWFSLPSSVTTDGSGAARFTDTPPVLFKQRFYRTRER